MSDNLTNEDNNQEISNLDNEESLLTGNNDIEMEIPSEKSIGFVERILEFFTGVSTDERIRLKKLKEIDRKLKRLKLKVYNFKKDQVLPGFSQFIYEIYRISQNFSKYFDIKNHSKSIKTFIFELFSTDAQKKNSEELEKTSIINIINSSVDPKDALSIIKAKLNGYVKSFDLGTIKKINSTYNQISDLSHLINFDWFSMLHKFDVEITESNFNYRPDFELIEGKYILDDLISIGDNLETIDLNIDWKNVFDYVTAYSNDENILKLLKKLIQYFKVLKRDDYVLLLSRLIYKNPFFRFKKFPSNVNIVQDFLNDFQNEIKKTIDHVLSNLKKEKINKILLNVFRTTAIIRLKNYTQKSNESFIKKNMSGFKLVDPVNYLKAFLLDFCKGEIKSRIDFLIIKGTWSTNSFSSEYSRMLDDFNNLSDRVIDFDNSCGEDENYGKNIRKLLFAVSHDPNAKILLNKLLFKIDSEALGLLTESIQLFTKVIEKFKTLIDDYNLKVPKMIIDFHKLRWDFSNDIPSELNEIIKKINLFLTLLKFYIKQSGERSDQ